MTSTIKENPNPVIHTTQKRSYGKLRSQLIGSAAINRYNLSAAPHQYELSTQFSTGTTLQLSQPPTAIERSVALALAAAAHPDEAAPNKEHSQPSNDFNLLKQAGFVIFHPRRIQQQCKTLRYTSFAPSSSSPSSIDGEAVADEDERKRDNITAQEVFDIIRNIQDPEHPLTLEQLNVVRLELIEVVDLFGDDGPGVDKMEIDPNALNGEMYNKKFSTVKIQFTPTIPHCSMATLIGLSLRVKLFRSLPPRFKVSVKIEPGTHVSEHAINKQLSDKERVRAALENEHLLGVVNRCIAGGMQM
mmetsp:Transcript_20253/g.42475  ORF Transcript_20253/g.42475 Transcript_20253/m.42475 type:complete len:302 (-) Transcript_20253:346-1251(-)